MAVKTPFEKIFPYFSYRWRYFDGEYSPYAPFNKVTFYPKDPDVEDFFKKGHNTSMVNSVETINLQGIDKGGPDVVAVDILYTESISSTVYVLKTIEIPESQRGDGFGINVKIDKRSFGTALPNDQLNRQFDNVPLKAKAQEVTANRLMYGNYVHKYDQDDNLSIEVGIQNLSARDNGPAVKTNRTYDVGVSYIDEYGRVGNLLLQKGAKESGEGSTFKTDFTYLFRPQLTAKIKSKAPSWAKYYRYYVKDVSGEHFNLSAFNVYNDGEESDNNSDNVYLQFNSDDRNKITDDTILIPRRHNFDGSEVILEGQSRHPVLDIENEAPDIVKNQVNERSVVPVMTFIESRGTIKTAATGNGGSSTTGATSIGDTTIFIADEAGRLFITESSNLNNYVASQDPNQSVVFDVSSGSTSSGLNDQTIDVSSYGERLVLRFQPASESDNDNYKTTLLLVDSITFLATGSHKKRNVFKFDLGNRVDENGSVIAGTGLDKGGHTFTSADPTMTLKLYKLGLSEEGAEKLKGSFFVKVPRDVVGNTNITTLPTGQTEFNEDGKVTTIKELNFETEPLDESNLNLYWETADTYDVNTDHGNINSIKWSNCITTVEPTGKKVYLESRKLLDKFNTVEIAKGVRVTTPEARYAQERRKAGIIFSGIYNSKTGINELNQFNMALNPTKELEPNYGGIQKLFTLDTNLLAFAEDKVFRVLADKDALFNADEGVNVTATNLVLGQAMVYQGQYGISTHPESFAFWGNNAYFTDAKRGVVMQLTPANGQLFPISSRGMSNFFRDRIGTANKLIGAYDGTKKQYVLSMQGYDPNAASIGSETIPNETSNITLGYSLRSEGWTSRFSFIPESGITMANMFYTFKNGKAYLHNSDTADRNNFYGAAYNSEVQIIFNDNPTFVSDFLTLNYEGDSNWEASEIIGDQDGIYNITNVRILNSNESGFLGWFLKEGKYRGSIVGTQPVYIIDPAGTVGSDGFWPLIQDGANTQDISGTKGFFAKVRFKNDATTAKELFAISSEYYISQT
jgi:hypothetical protein